MIDYKTIQKILPQSSPFILIDKIIDFKKGESLTAIKNITGNEWIFDEGALAGCSSIFPETLLIEAAAQAALVLYGLTNLQPADKQPQYILGRSKAEFENFVYIGDQITLSAVASKMLDTGGYSDIKLSKTSQNIGTIEIIYKVIR